jgi:hypothetical protein
MTNKTQQIRIESIWGGISALPYQSRDDEYYASILVDPDVGSTPGAIQPRAATGTGEAVFANSALWVVPTPKTSEYFVYDADGSVYSSSSSFAGIGDLNDGGTASGNGAAYYDNYLYCARDTTIARYGPLNGTPAWTDDYWVSTLGKTTLSNTSYPSSLYGNISRPNHFLHRHSDGRLYIADVVGNQGTLHYIATTKTTVEGDTDNGSKYNALDLPFGYWPVCLTSYGSMIVAAVFEGNTSGSGYGRSKIIFWDGISDSPNQTIDLPFGDRLISAMLNVNGVLYVWSGSDQISFTRISRYIGGDSFEQVRTIDSPLPWPGAVDHSLARIFFGGVSNISAVGLSDQPCVYALGSNNVGGLSLHAVHGLSSTGASEITALKLRTTSFDPSISIMWAGGSSGTDGFTEDIGTYRNGPYPLWVSKFYRIGAPFKITKIRFEGSGSSSSEITPTIHTDFGSFTGASNGLPVITSANYPGTTNAVIVMRPVGVTGEMYFALQFQWTVHTSPIAIPPTIIIEYEPTHDN